MGQDIHIRITKYNKDTNFFEEVALYRKVKPSETPYKEDINGFRKIYIDAGRDYEMFDGIKDGSEEDGYGYFPSISIAINSLEPSLREEIKEKKSTFGCFDFMEVNLLEMDKYVREHPTVTDYESDEWEEYEAGQPRPQKDNPIIELYEKILNYINIADNYYCYTPCSYYKIIFYFDT